MIHTTYRRLDEPPKLGGFSFVQWGALLVLGAAVYGLEQLLSLPTQPAITLFAFAVGLPACLTYFSENGRPSLARLLADAIRWLLTIKTRTAGAGTPKPLHVALPEPKPARKHRRLHRGRPRLLLRPPATKDGSQ